MARLTDRILRRCQPARVSWMVGRSDIERFVRERVFEGLHSETAPQDFANIVAGELNRFRNTEPVSTQRFDPQSLSGAPIFVGDEVAVYVDSLPDGTDFSELVGPMAPPFERFFIEFQDVPNKAGVFAWGTLVTAHDYSEIFGRFEEDSDTPRWILELTSFLEREKGRPFGPVATHVAGLAEDGTWFRHSDGSLWWGGGCTGIFTPPPPPEAVQDWGDNVAQLLFPALLTISFLHCRNVEVREVAPPDKLARKHRKKHGQDLVRYHVLDVAPIRGVVEAVRLRQRGTFRRALHICRGHFKTFTADAPLLGRHTGTYWWAPQVRGSKKEGVVAKDYRVSAPLDAGRLYLEADESAFSSPAEAPVPRDPDSAGRGLAAHNRTQNALARTIRSLGWLPRSPKAGEPEFDLAWKVKDALFVCEVKSLTPENEERQLRIAIGQVIRYRQKLAAAGHEPIYAVVATECEPTDPSWNELFADEGIVLVWPTVAEARLQVAARERAV